MPIIKDDADIIFSCLSGYNFYQLNKGEKLKNSTMQAIHCLDETGVEILKTGTQLTHNEIEKWKYFVEHPVDVTNMLWPIDIVSFEDDTDIGLVFRSRAKPKIEALKNILYNEDELDWKNKKIQALVISFLKRCIDLHINGYAYHSFDINRMFYNPVTMEVFFDFSLSITKKDQVTVINHSDVGIEFLPPWCEIMKDNEMGIFEEYYSITAILFRLLIGRMPYQGRLMDGKGNMMNLLTDMDEDLHIMMFESYHNIPIFIFDKENTTNSIGLYTNEEKYVKRWNSLPENIKKMFSESLIVKNGEISKTYSGLEWLNALEKYVFAKSKGDCTDE